MGKEIAEIIDLLKKRKAIFFLGAGISVEAGLPSWPKAIEQLAGYISKKDSSMAQVMRDRLRSMKLLEAGELYYLSDTDEDFKIKGLELVFGKEPKITDRLRHLIGISPSAFITTNYDLVIEQIWSDVWHKNILSLRNNKEEFPTAYRKLNEGLPFVFHLHGSMEAPRDIIFSKSHFENILNRDEYLQFLRHIFMTKSLIFVGLSFDDPALKQFLDYAIKKLSIICEQPSFAFIGSEELDLGQILQRAHVTPIFYSNEGDHGKLWSMIKEIHDFIRKEEKFPAVEPSEEIEVNKLRSNLAAVYAHYRIKTENESAAESIYAGIIRTIGWEIQQRCGRVNHEDLTDSLRKLLHVEADKAKLIVSKSIKILVRMGLLSQSEGFFLFEMPDNTISDDLDKLILSIRDRSNIRHSYKIMLEDEKIKEFLLVSLVKDGVRLAHSILSRYPLAQAAIDAILESSYKDIFGDTANRDREFLLLSIKSLLDSPNQEEATILGSISRIAFLTDLILHEPDLKAYNIKSRPSAVYIDANFLLPAICTYHPRNIFYYHILEKAKKTGMKITVQEGFIEETISHRKLAIEEFDKEFRGRRKRFEDYVYYNGASNINVFLGGFAGWLSADKDYVLKSFLNECAPYENQGELTAYLLEKGFQVEHSIGEMSLDKGRIARWKAFLKEWYKDRHRYKEDPLLNHEAVLLETLKTRYERGDPGWFLTADRQFILGSISICVEVHLGPEISTLLITPPQMSYFVDMDDDRNIDWKAYAKLLWSRSYKNYYERYSDRFTDKVLREYEPKLVTKIPDLLKDIQKEVEKSQKIPIDLSENEEPLRIKEFRYFESFEEKFYELMRREKEKLGLM